MHLDCALLAEGPRGQQQTWANKLERSPSPSPTLARERTWKNSFSSLSIDIRSILMPPAAADADAARIGERKRSPIWARAPVLCSSVCPRRLRLWRRRRELHQFIRRRPLMIQIEFSRARGCRRRRSLRPPPLVGRDFRPPEARPMIDRQSAAPGRNKSERPKDCPPSDTNNECPPGRPSSRPSVRLDEF